MNHAFIDGNKRISMHMLALFLRFNDIEYKPTNLDVIRIGLALADHKMTYEELVDWVKTIIKQ